MKKPPRRRIERLLDRFGEATVLVAGDLMLDRFVWGSVTRISPEAPVPIVEVTSETDVPGGAANVVGNICALGGTACVAGVIGEDRIGRALLERLAHRRIDLAGVIVDPARSTTLKTRIIAHSQQVVRVDKEATRDIGEGEIERILSFARARSSRLGAIIIEDYGKGIVRQSLVAGLVRLSRRRGITLAADPKKGHPIDYRGVTVMTPNREEAVWLAGDGKAAGADPDAIGQLLIRRFALHGVLITLGEKGMCLCRGGRPPVRIPTAAREVFDVSGAGDTVVSAFTLALAAGASMEEAAFVANHAAGVVVGKVGTAVVSRKEIIEAIYR
ncbi:MAG: PfkB family carbohydrate kinase [bacterium]|nr:PfkB family carbohydrate kinase [bacterium]